MGVDLHITRAEDWAENEGLEITLDEWLSYVTADPELTLSSERGGATAIWNGLSKYEDPWLSWFQGNIYTKWPDTALYIKMLQIAAALGAKVQDDEGKVYTNPMEWSFDPTEARPVPIVSKKPATSWWRRALGRED